MHLERGDIVVGVNGEEKLIGRIVRVIASRSACELNYWDEKTRRFRIKEFGRGMVKPATLVDKENFKNAARGHNLELVGPVNLARR